ncbi:NAD kinase [Microbacterium sp. CnD16-F]|uniref:NAD kinase n=1 Tax=unclassified Microbacterium TaxID=2609290 RepID=UPI0020973AD5|nr:MULTISPECIES: NAD kinase [unclassified Microbacterium]MCO7202433.1 NAD kinase [Microbacterium sp. CnD16-F]MDT0178609.1 NAD kinase [Microbacterium sp. ARD31]
MTDATRNILVVAHALRENTVEGARRVVAAVHEAGLQPVLPGDDPELAVVLGDLDTAILGEGGVDVTDIEVAIVLGGDGTILRAAELVRAASVPILGVNMGHVGFLAELEADDIDEAIGRALARDYEIHERMTLSVEVRDAQDAVVYRTWALNEATVEKASRERMLEVMIEIDGRPLSSFGCDGVVVATPTGSTAYNFSAGGPVVWPSVQALCLVPLSAHALFARPVVLGPETSVSIDVLERNQGRAVLWSDGRRSHDLPPGARVVVRRSTRPVRLARLHPSVFTDRLVRKFQLPVAGWRGATEATP